MPSSRFDLIPSVLSIVTEYRPKSILDVGVGYGKYGVLFREYLDVWDTKNPYNDFQVKLYGVEAFPAYRNPIWGIYNIVFEKDIISLLPTLTDLGKFDLLFMGDVIEHLTKEEGRKVLSEIQYDKLIVITPRIVSPQEAVYGNTYEIHKSSWTTEDFPGMNHYEFNNQQIFWN